MEHQKHLKLQDLQESFPWHQYSKMLPNQKEALEIIAKISGSVTLELPTGTGKTAVGYTVLKALEKAGYGPLFYIAPNKALVNQVKDMHPEVKVVYGRNEYPCLYYQKEKVTAEEAPCSMLDCPHRVNQETGQTKENEVNPCPYLLAKYQAKQGGIVVCTVAFYLFTQFFTHEWDEPAGLIIDEAHRIARIIRNCLSYEITDYHLKKAIKLLKDIDEDSAQILKNFLNNMIRTIRLKPVSKKTLLEAHEIRGLMDNLIEINSKELWQKIRQAVKEGVIDPEKQREVLKRLETVTGSLSRYYRDLEYSLPTEKRHPLKYTYAYYLKSPSKRERVQYRLVVNAYRVGQIVKRIMSPFTVSYSATIGDPEYFGFETGIEAPFYTLPSKFPVNNTRIFLPKDTPNLAVKSRSRREPIKVLRRIAKYCREFADCRLRSLVVVVSNVEKQKFLKLCEEEGVEAISYGGNGLRPREAAIMFKKGEGDVLVGTVANYGEGVDLPKKLAPVIFFLRPSYPPPSDPGTVFEERRYGSGRWRIWNWRVMIEALQVRGRNIRSTKDLGVTFFVSQQFRRFTLKALPEWLRKAYRDNLTFERGVEEAKRMLNKKK